ncbi:MAG: helix-turn-helix domain-containing protein [Clostridia bacterium]|nr:helix-turn-helix domain-containing protein [Clostridia bacterium]
MAKRKTFYVPAAIFEGDYSAYAVAVYAYLCFCADKNGVCFPAIETIAAHTGMSRNTVKKAIGELKNGGLICTEATRMKSRNGRVRQSANRYYLNVERKRDAEQNRHEVTTAVSRGDPTPGQETPPPRSPDGREINNNSKDIMGDVPSVGTNAREDATGLDAILEPLYLDSFFDQVFAQSVKQAIGTMYRMPSLSVNGTRLDNAAIRERLRLLTIDHIDYVESQLDRFAGDVCSGERYLMACLYNAPLDCMVKNAKNG